MPIKLQKSKKYLPKQFFSIPKLKTLAVGWIGFGKPPVTLNNFLKLFKIRTYISPMVACSKLRLTLSLNVVSRYYLEIMAIHTLG